MNKDIESQYKDIDKENLRQKLPNRHYNLLTLSYGQAVDFVNEYLIAKFHINMDVVK